MEVLTRADSGEGRRDSAKAIDTSALSGLCLDAAGGATGDGTLVQLWGCTGAANQQWQLN